MPHLSDGELHAYLDGALELLPGGRAEEIREHLRTCEACRSRLAEERALLERSAAILDGAAPAVAEAPPLEELRERARIREARAEEERGRRWRPMPGTQVLAWAATVVLALGIGWVTRDLTGLRSPVARPELQSVEPADRGAPDLAADADAADADAAAREPAADDDPERVEPSPVEETGPPAVPGEEAGGATGAGERASLRQAPPSAEEEREEAAPAATVAGRVLDETSLAPLVGAQIVLEDSAGVSHAGTLTGPDGRFTLRADTPGTYRAVVSLIGYGSTRTELFELSAAETVAREIRAAPQEVSLEALVVTGVPSEEGRAAEGAAAVPTPEAAASLADARPSAEAADLQRRRLEMPEDEALAGVVASGVASSHVPGLPVVSVEPESDPPGFRIAQRLPDGGTLLLRWIGGFALDEDAARAAAYREPLPEGWSQVVLRRGDGWLVARAPLGETELRALLAR